MSPSTTTAAAAAAAPQPFLAHQKKQQLSAAIIGAGIAGLACAIALSRSRSFASITIYERSTFKSEVGAAITMTPNGNRILDRWRFDAQAAGETEKRQLRRVSCNDPSEVVYRDGYEGVREGYGAGFNAFHRVDLHGGLREMVERKEEEEEGVRIELGREAVRVDCEEGRVWLKKGGELEVEEVRVELVVLADGYRSPFVKDVTGTDLSMQKVGMSVFRTLVPFDRIMADERSRVLFENEESGFLVSTRSNKGVQFVTYPCRRDELMNCAIFHKTREHQKDAMDWNAPATVEEALEALEGFHPAWRAIIENADFMKVYTLGYRPVASGMIKGRAVMIGDAAHPMMPTHAQGGSMGLEDAAALEVLMANLTSADDIPKRLRLFQQVRLPRDATTQLLSNMRFYSSTDLEVAVREFYKGPLPPADAEAWSQPLRDFFYPYDVYKESEKAMGYVDSKEGGGVPEGVLNYFGIPS